MTPAALRGAWVAATAQFGLSERRACRLVGIHRSVARYKPRREAPTELLTRLRELASERRRYGYRRLAVMLRREGSVVNHKKVYRLYREEGLAVRRLKEAEEAGWRGEGDAFPAGG